MFLVNLGPQLGRLRAQLLRVLLECGKLVTPQVRLGHEEVETARETTNLGLEFVAGIDECGGTLSDGVLDVLLGSAQMGCATRSAEGGDALEEGWFLELWEWVSWDQS
jgi:hypothetical protein